MALSEPLTRSELLKLMMAPVNQRAIGEMELVPSAVRPNPIEQRCRIAEVRTPRRRVESRGGEGPPSSSSGAWRFLRGPGPRVLLGPVRKDKKASDLQDPLSASVSAQAKRDCNRELAEGELASCPRGLPARKRKRADGAKVPSRTCRRRVRLLSPGTARRAIFNFFLFLVFRAFFFRFPLVIRAIL